MEVRKKLEKCHGLGNYKDVWKDEVFARVQLRFPQAVNNWDGVVRAFRLRNRLVHGATSCGTEYARERVCWAIYAANDVRSVCINHGIDLDSRLPVRRFVGS